MHAELIEDDGESRYKITDIIGAFTCSCKNACYITHPITLRALLYTAF